MWRELSEGEARCLMKMAAKSGNSAVFSKAKEAVLSKGKVNPPTTRAFNHDVR